MRRFTLYSLVALVTFGISLFVAYEFYWTDKDEFTSPAHNSLVEEIKQHFPETKRESKESRKPFCQDERILPVWNLITEDEFFLEQSGGTFESPNCSDMFEVLNTDLNKDKTKEVILRAKSFDLCGAVGNCGFWIFEKKGKSYQKILSATDYADVTKMGNQIIGSRTNGYYDVLLKAHLNASDTRYSTYKFNGRNYVESKCLINCYIRGTNKNPKWEFIGCLEYQKLNNF